jgi:hypothetical protein
MRKVAKSNAPTRWWRLPIEEHNAVRFEGGVDQPEVTVTRVVPLAVRAPGERVGVAVEGGDRIGHFGRDQLGEPSQPWSAWPTMG